MAADIIAMFIYYHMVKNFIASQPQQFRADVAVIFYGDTKDGELGDDSRLRADKGLELYRSGSISYFICAGGYRNGQLSIRPHMMKEYLEDRDVDPARIYYDSLSFNTITNWEEAQKIISRRGFQRIAVVSAPWHVYRIAKMIGDDSVIFSAYDCRLHTLIDYWELVGDIHHEWISLSLSALLDNTTRNRLVGWIRENI
ncbi:MAG: YdcF family protein [Bacteroidales bacterium]|nr:YdcF family protein [Bacteroidales bacterium]